MCKRPRENTAQHFHVHHGKFNFTAANPNSSRQIQIHHSELTFAAANLNSLRQFQIRKGHFKFSMANSISQECRYELEGECGRESGLDIIFYLSTVKYLHKFRFKWEWIQRFLGVDTVNSLRYSKVVGWNSHKTENSSFFYSQGKVRLSPNLAWSYIYYWIPFKMTRQVFFKLSRTLEPDMAGIRKQHKICNFHHHPNMDAMVENG